jgi:large subunit ribosomal protein L21
MYAVIESGSKQYRVQLGDIVEIEKVEGEAGSTVNFDKVLFAATPAASETESSQIWLGKPYLSGAKVQGQIVGQGRGEKILIVKMKRRKQYRRTQGHRQYQTQILVTNLDNGAGQTAALSATDTQAKLASFRTNLKPKGAPAVAKTLGSRTRLSAAVKKTQAAPAGEAKAKSKAKAKA